MGLHAWQYADYREFHQDMHNLRIHIVAVPVFLLGNLLFLAGLVWTPLMVVGFTWSWLPIALLVGGPVLSAAAMAAQGRGHASESNPPKPFTGPGNALARIFVEQWVTFPRFVLSGGWSRALRTARSNAP